MSLFFPPCVTRRHALRALVFATLPLIAGCSGSGGQTGAPGLPGTTTTATNPAPPPVNYDTTEYRKNWGLDAVSALSAYQAGYTGAGVTVAVVDTGIDVNNAELKANIASASTNVVTNNPADLQDTDGHGTAVAGLVAAVHNGVGTEGVAFNATILAINASSACGTNCNFYQDDIANGIDYARLHGARVINLSMGGTAVGVTLEESMRRAVTAGMIIVIAASNDAAANPSDFAQVAEAGWANGQILIAGATDQLNQLASFSNKAGDLAKNFYLVAPGVNVVTTHLGGGLAIGSGTSFSTPVVAGATAILLQEFPNLSAQQVANILLTTATDLGAPGVDNVYGYGLLDLARAIAPIGTASIPTSGGSSSVAAGSGGTLTASAVHLSGAFGDALAGSTALTKAMILDGYRRSYRMDLTTRIERDEPLPDLLSLTEPGLRNVTRDLHPIPGTSLHLSADQDASFAEIDRRYFANTDPARRQNFNFRWRLSQKFGDNLSLEAGSHVALDSGLSQDNANLFLTQPETRNIATGKSDDLSMAVHSRLGAQTSITMTAAHNHLHDDLYRLDGRQSTATARLTQSFSPNFSLSLDLGVVSETGAVLGALSSGALALGDGAITRYAGLGMNWRLASNIQIFGTWMSGRTRVESAANSLFRNVSDLHTQSFRAGIAASAVLDKADRMGFMISEPLRVTSGQAQMMFAAARDYTRDTITLTALNTSLRPTGRELDLEASYQIPLTKTLWMQTMLLHQIDAGHVANGPSQTLALIRLSTPF